MARGERWRASAHTDGALRFAFKRIRVGKVKHVPRHALIVDGDRFLGLCAVGLCGLTVALPWLLERGARTAFGLGQPRWGVRMTGLRALLMPGAGLGRQQQILAGFGLLDRKGPAAALAHFRALLAEAEDPAELAMIHEQIVAMLLYDLRWSEATSHYESQFQPGYAALRPALVLGMLKALGELGRMREAGTLLRALEEGPLGQEPGAAELIGQARLTFLAYAGATTTVDAAVAVPRLSKTSGGTSNTYPMKPDSTRAG